MATPFATPAQPANIPTPADAPKDTPVDQPKPEKSLEAAEKDLESAQKTEHDSMEGLATATTARKDAEKAVDEARAKKEAEDAKAKKDAEDAARPSTLHPDVQALIAAISKK
jgi:hypothetical protein